MAWLNKMQIHSFRQTPLPGAASSIELYLVQLCFTKPGSAHSFRTDKFRAFSFQCSSFALVWFKGEFNIELSHQPALQTRALSTALTLISLSFALDAWLKTSSNRAWKKKPFEKELVQNIFVNKIFTNSFSNNINNNSNK